MARSVEIRLKVNGKECSGHCESRTSLADFLRDHLNLTGTHTGCEHGVCGVCTILVNGEAVRSCIMLAVQANGADVVTIEGLAQSGEFHPVQKAFHENHALQCGFCTPGMLATTIDFLKINASPSEAEVKEALSAVLCRCTGYQNIIKAVMAAAAEIQGERKLGALADV
jgi:aerobic-type carbon monoxide dehydrogenase small subunit (CoxS/CutS family)